MKTVLATLLILLAGSLVPLWASDVTVTAETINVRSGPGIDYSVVTRLRRGQIVTANQQINDWTQIVTPQGASGWVSSRFLTPIRQRSAQLNQPSHNQPTQTSAAPEMVVIHAGCLEMQLADNRMAFAAGDPMTAFASGSASGLDASGAQKPVKVCLSKDFALGKYEVTQAQWQAIMGDNPSKHAGCADCPVEQVSVTEAQEFIQRLNAKTGGHYRLPSEAEWEYACREGGNKQTYCGGEKIDELAWHLGNSGRTTHPVGMKRPNQLGLFDMSGNVQEWVQDCWNETYAHTPTDGSPFGPPPCISHVVRGGSWFDRAGNGRSNFRLGMPYFIKHITAGFRLARSL